MCEFEMYDLDKSFNVAQNHSNSCTNIISSVNPPQLCVRESVGGREGGTERERETHRHTLKKGASQRQRRRSLNSNTEAERQVWKTLGEKERHQNRDNTLEKRRKGKWGKDQAFFITSSGKDGRRDFILPFAPAFPRKLWFGASTELLESTFDALKSVITDLHIFPYPREVRPTMSLIRRVL